jgi:thymidylate kinase
MRGPFDSTADPRSGMLVLSGLDGTGKSTQAALLAERMSRDGLYTTAVWSRWEPHATAPMIRLAKRSLRGTNGIGENDYLEFTDAKRHKMRSPWKRAVWQAMVWGEYAVQVRQRVLSPLNRGIGVICDRYVYDTMIDIAVNFSLSPGGIETLCNHPLLSLFPKPVSVVFFDIDPRIGSRRKNDGTPAEYLADRRSYYLEMAHLLGAPIIDAGGTIDDVFSELLEHVEEWKKSLPLLPGG